MSVKASIQNLRTNLKVRQEQMNAQAQATISTSRGRTLAIMPVALAFVMMLAAIAGPASAATSIDWSVLTGLLNNVSSEVIPAMVDFIISIVPAIVVLSIVGFVVTFLDKILSIFDKIFK